VLRALKKNWVLPRPAIRYRTNRVELLLHAAVLLAATTFVDGF